MTVIVNVGEQEYTFESMTLDRIIKALFDNQNGDEIYPLSIKRSQEILADIDSKEVFELQRISNDSGHMRQLGLTIDLYDLYQNAQVLEIDEKQYNRGEVVKKGNRLRYSKDTNLSLDDLLTSLLEQDYAEQLSADESMQHSDSSEKEAEFQDQEEALASQPVLDPEMEEFVCATPSEELLPSPTAVPSTPEISHVSSDEESKADEQKAKGSKWSLPSMSEFKWPSLFAGIASVGARSLSVLTLGGLLSTPVVGLITFVGSYVGQKLRENFKKSSHDELLSQKDPNEVAINKLISMQEPDWQAVKHGFEAQKGILNQFKSCARPGDWTHPKAFYAGYRHAEIDPNMDVSAIEDLRKASLK